MPVQKKSENILKAPRTNIDTIYCPVAWGFRIHWQHLYREIRPCLKECPVYDTKQYDGESPERLELRETEKTFIAITPRSTLVEVVVLDRVLSIGQIELFGINWGKTNYLYYIDLFKIEPFDHLTMCKQMTDDKLNC